MQEVSHRTFMLSQTGFIDLHERHQSLGDHLLEQRRLAAEVVTNRAGTYARTLGDLHQRGALVAVAAELEHRAVEDLAAALVGTAMPFGFVLDFPEFSYSH